MEKRTVLISKTHILNLLLFVFALFFIVKGISAYIESANAVNLSELELSECTEGQYVYGWIDSYLVSQNRLYNSNTYQAVSYEEVSFGGNREYYTIPIADNKYIRIGIADKQVLELLENFEQGKGSGIYIEGKIERSGHSLNYYWCEGAGFEQDKAEQMIHPQYAIIPISFEDQKEKLYFGIILMVLSVLLFWHMGGINEIVVKERIEVPRKKIEKETGQAFEKESGKES